MTISIELYYARFGALARPFLNVVGFDYNRVYNSFDDIILDFEIRGWTLVESTPGSSSDEVVSLFCVFHKDDANDIFFRNY